MPQALPADKQGSGTAVLFLRVVPKLKTKLKTLAAKKKTTVQDLCVEAVEQYLETQ